MADFFGYKRDVKPNGALVSSELATLYLNGNTKISLVQSVQASYQHQVTPKFESGSPTLYWLSGQPQGSITFSRLIGQEGYLSDAGVGQLGGQCGSLLTISLGLDGTNICTAVQTPSAKKLKFSGAIPQSVNVVWQAGSLEVQEGATILVSTMEYA